MMACSSGDGPAIDNVIAAGRDRLSVSAGAANQIADPVDHRLSQVRLERPDRPMLEALDVFQYAQDGVLHDVLGVEAGAGVRRKPPARPSAQQRQRALEQHARGRAIAAPGAFEHVDRRFVRRIVVRSRGHNPLCLWAA